MLFFLPLHVLLRLSTVPVATAAADSSLGSKAQSLAALTLPPQQPSFSTFSLELLLPPAYPVLATPINLPPPCESALPPSSSAECFASSMEALNVTFEDCGTPYTICRCGDAEMTMDTAIRRLGQVPVGLRRYVATVLALAEGTGEARAYTVESGDIHFFGECELDTWVHESTHAYDFANPNAWQSSAEGWAQAIDADTCVPDLYSQTNIIEDFAQLSVIMIYTLLHSGSLPPGFSAGCMQHQLNFMSALDAYVPGVLFGNNCNIIDNGPTARHTESPATLDPSRTFTTFPVPKQPSLSSLQDMPTGIINSGGGADTNGVIPASGGLGWTTIYCLGALIWLL
ncbi:hypothetical protein MIND_00189800 [Mycena indigotica]|uniref:Uncharacterized protein n=1 Tax=Mycena indigotica TaxID=2126181 RepID=A0A8H6WEF3_9AGAR|nr:uncharacterized protein MIND_00189800 [Mycena indigotica]KAF7311793.1 hypothetical protein MIND_00189800 [Mycena indigotica]